nr:MAG: ORF1 [TTV-like mini virus]
MPPFQRYRNYYRNWWNGRRRRAWYRRRRPRKTFRSRKRRYRRVRRKPFKRLKKTKKLTVKQYQPMSIRKCRIEGFLCMFQAGYGRYANQYTMWKESIFPPKYAGGGGWAIHKLSLATLYSEHKEHMNYWTATNERLNLCRYLGCKVILYRQRFTDYIFTWMEEEPRNVSKYYYCSHHPLRLLTHKRKVVVPSLTTKPHKKKPYKTKWIPPPRIMKNQWFFQQQLSPYPLLTFAVSACSLNNMFGSDDAVSNNCSIWCIDTQVFTSPFFNFRGEKPKWGYQIANSSFLYGVDSQHLAPGLATWKQAIYLGNTMENKRGTYMTSDNVEKFDTWGNPFHWSYLNGNLALAQSTATQDPKSKAGQSTTIGSAIKDNPIVFQVRYNPFKDKGEGNQLYFVPNYLHSKTDWSPTNDPDIIFENYPLWLMAWGLEDILKRIGKTTDLQTNWTAVFKSNYLSQKEQYFVPISHNFILGKGPYETEHEDLAADDITNWYPRWKYQREAFNNIIMTGPAVARGDNAQNIQATLKYQFFFKWGGNSSPQANIFDPVNQPVTPYPHNFNLFNEITNPATTITGEIYPWDFRRDYLTDTAAERIKESLTNDSYVFTDGDPTQRQQISQEAPQKKTAQETQTQALFQQLQQIQQFNNELQLRFQHLKQLFSDL